MLTWHDFSLAESKLAAFGTQRLIGQVAYLATLRPDGSPRLHPISPIIGQGHLFVYMEPTSPKGHDLQRDARYALHCSVEDNNGGQGEFSVSGRAYLTNDPAMRALAFQAGRALGHSPQERYVVYEFGVEEAFSTIYEDTGPVRKRWTAAVNEKGS